MQSSNNMRLDHVAQLWAWALPCFDLCTPKKESEDIFTESQDKRTNVYVISGGVEFCFPWGNIFLETEKKADLGKGT